METDRSESTATSGAVEAAAAVNQGLKEFLAEFGAATDAGAEHFRNRRWEDLHLLARYRLDLYEGHVGAVVERLRSGATPELWAEVKAAFVDLAPVDVSDIAATFYNSVTRRLFETVGVDSAVEFVAPGAGGVDEAIGMRTVDVSSDLEEGLRTLLLAADLAPTWRHLTRDVTLAGDEIRQRIRYLGLGDIREFRIAEPVFYRGRSAYLIGFVDAERGAVPLAIAIHNTVPGLAIGAVLMESSQLTALFSYTRASFFVDVEHPRAMVQWLNELLPHKASHELYSAIGFRKHGKTELFQDIKRHVESTEHQFVQSRGIRGMVMIVFDVEGLDVVFKLIRDRFPYPKQTTRRAIEAKYRQVHRHDRAGRMIDAYSFEHLRLPLAVFSDQLLAELRTDATRCVVINADHVTLEHVYVERKVVPLDVYVREANPIKAEAAIIDYGRAIKNLAAANIFPGDMLLKNFGVTQTGRVVFYDYDELCKVTECRFRDIPESTNPHDDMSADPWFPVGEGDVFPEEFVRFLGIRGELREAFEAHHGDLFDARFWLRAQQRASAGESIEVFPYDKSARLGATLRTAPALS